MKKAFISAVLSGIAAVILGLAPRVIPAATRVEDELRVPDSNHVQLLVKEDGTEMWGRVVKLVADYVYFQTEDDTLKVFIPDIHEVKEVPLSRIKNGRYRFPNPNLSRLYLAPTGRPLPKGEGYVAGYYILVPVAAYGVTENFTLAGGATFLTAVNIGGAYLLPKLGFEFADFFSASVGMMAAQGVGPGYYSPRLLAGFAVGTLGKPDASISIGAGYGTGRLYSRGSREETRYYSTPGLMVGGEVRLGRKVSLVTENYFIREWANYRPVLSYGIRFFGENFSLEGAFGYTPELTQQFPGFPFAAIVYNF